MKQMTIPISQTEGQMQHWQALLDSAAEGIWGLDLEGNCTFVNRMAVSTFGFDSEELLGRNMHELVHHHYPDGRHFPDKECPIYDVVRNNKALRQMTDMMFRKNGSSFIAEISAQPVSVEGCVVGVVVTFREVTELRQQQEDLSKAYELAERWSTETVKASDRWIRSVAAPILLNGRILGGVAVNSDVTQVRLQDEALRRSEKLAAVGQLASSIAHEINNPLESITNLLYLIRQSESMEDVQHYTMLAQGELARVTEITLQTLRFNRHQSKPVEVDMSELLRTVMALYTGRIMVRGIDADMKLIPSPRVLSLEGEIRQVMNNLVRNALDAMSSGGRLLVRLHPQRDWHSGATGVRLTVADTGEGIRPEMRAHLFEPFQTTKEMTGTGLGLWVSKGIVEKHGGYIRTRTRRDKRHGTVFTVWLPVGGSANLTAPAN